MLSINVFFNLQQQMRLVNAVDEIILPCQLFEGKLIEVGMLFTMYSKER